MVFIIKKKGNGELGVFALQAFTEGEVVLEKGLKSQQVTLDEVEALSKMSQHYVGVFENKFFLLPEPTRYLAHSCSPNIKWVDGTKYATRNIKEGEELAIDYEIGGQSFLSFKCECGEKNCRGYIQGYKKF